MDSIPHTMESHQEGLRKGDHDLIYAVHTGGCVDMDYRAKVAAGETIRQTLQSPVRAEDSSEETVAVQRGTYNPDVLSQV